MNKVKLVIGESNIAVYERLTDFFKQQDIEFEVAIEPNPADEPDDRNHEHDNEIIGVDLSGGKTMTKAARILQDFSGTVPNKKLDERISNIFITVGIPAHIKGYQFLREAVKLTIEKPEIISSITKQLYPSIAKRFGTTASKVERAIRHAIEVGWNRGKVDSVNTIFGVKAFDIKDKPTNGEFIALIADKMLLEGA